MEIRCFGCGGSMGTNDAIPNDRIKVWYGLHDEWGCGAAMTQGEWSYFSEHVLAQNRLPRKGEGRAISSARANVTSTEPVLQATVG